MSSQEFSAVKAQSILFKEANDLGSDTTPETGGSGAFLSPSVGVPGRTTTVGDIIYCANEGGKMRWGPPPAVTDPDLEDLNDVETTDLSENDVLIYDTVSTAWINKQYDLRTMPSTNLTPVINEGEILKWNATSSQWVNTGNTVNDLSDVNITSVTNGQTLTWDNAESEWVNSTISGSGSSGADGEIQISDGSGGFNAFDKLTFSDASDTLSVTNRITTPDIKLLLIGRNASGVNDAGTVELRGGSSTIALDAGNTIIRGGNTSGTDPSAGGGYAQMISGTYGSGKDPARITAKGATNTSSPGVELTGANVTTDEHVRAGFVTLRAGNSDSTTRPGGTVTVQSGVNSTGSQPCGDVILDLGESPAGTTLNDSKVGKFLVESAYGILDMPVVVHDSDKPGVGSTARVTSITTGTVDTFHAKFSQPSFATRCVSVAHNISSTGPQIVFDHAVSSSGDLATSFSAPTDSFTVVPGLSYILSFSINWENAAGLPLLRNLKWIDFTAGAGGGFATFLDTNIYPESRAIDSAFSGTQANFNAALSFCFTIPAGVTAISLVATYPGGTWGPMGIHTGSSVSIHQL